MIFDYLDGEPIIPLKIWSKNNTWVEFQAYADSGAGYSVFHQDTAMILGINYRQGSLLKLTVGNGDKLPVYLHRAKVNFANKEFYAQIAFSKNLVVGVNSPSTDGNMLEKIAREKGAKTAYEYLKANTADPVRAHDLAPLSGVLPYKY